MGKGAGGSKGGAGRISTGMGRSDRRRAKLLQGHFKISGLLMPNKRKPTGLKLVEGTDRKDRAVDEPEYEPTNGAEPPDWLLPGAVAEWNRLTELLESQRVLTDADLTMLGHLCNYHEKVVRTWRQNETPHAAVLTQLRMMYLEFGLTPASRAKVSKTGEGRDANPFGKLGEGA